MNPLRPVEGEDASGSDRQVSVGWGEENDTRAKRLATLSVLDRNPAGVADDLGQHTPLRWVPVLHHGDCGSEFGRQRREDMIESRDSPGRCPDDYHFEHRIGAQVGGRRRVFGVVVHRESRVGKVRPLCDLNELDDLAA